MPEIDRSPETVKAYEALAKEVNDQWDFAVENLGINFEPWNEDGQPYANSREMMEDVRNNNHLYFFRGGGKHEFMSQVDPETGLTSIDKLRAIHDLYGHAAEDYQFGPRGEENAWLKHSQMFTPEAQRALSVGTRGQNSWVNFGDQNYENGVNKNIPAKDRPYAPQKMALLPEELTDWRSALGQSEPERSSVLAKQPIRESVTDDPVDADYLSAVKSGDTKAQQQMVDEAAKAAGYDIGPVFHDGTFNPSKGDAVFKIGGPQTGNAIFFSSSPKFDYKIGNNISKTSVFLKGDGMFDFQNPKNLKRYADSLNLSAEEVSDINAGSDAYSENGVKYRGVARGVWSAFENPEFESWAKTAGFDGFTLLEYGEDLNYGVYNPNQIKSADPITRDAQGNVIPLSQRFNKGSEDIRYSLTDEPVERVPEEGDPDYEEIEDTESALGAAANVRERDDLSPTSALNTLYAKKSAVPVPTTGKRTNGQVAEQLRQAAIAYWGKELSSSNLTEEDIARLVDNGVEEVLAGLKASNHAGNWYTTAIRKAMAIAGVLHPELTDDALAQKAGFKDAHAAEVGLAAAMAITSQNLNVEKNTAYANDQFNILKKTGRFDPSKVYGSKAEAISGNLELANVLLDKVGWDGMEGFLNREYTLKQLNDVASQLLGQKISITGKVDDVVNGSAIFGPKIGGGFFQNLRGNFNPVTVDLWMRRTWGRWTGNVLPDPLDAKRLARMIDGMRESGIQLPEELRSIRTIIAKKGRKVPTLSDAAAERVLSDPQAVTAAYDFAALQEARWNKIYGEVRQNITPEQAEAIRNGSLSLEELNRQQQKSLRQKRDAWQDLEDRPSISTKEGKAAQKELFATMDAEAGRTAILTNEELSDNKPEWAKSARVIKTLLKPIDVPSDIDRRAIVDVVNRIRTELDRQGVSATNADIQAILWYPEKDLWAKLAGKKESNLKNSYDEEFLRVAESQGLGNEARSASAKVRD
jgi:hypothetical protein